jgi:hypothetical protein
MALLMTRIGTPSMAKGKAEFGIARGGKSPAMRAALRNKRIGVTKTRKRPTKHLKPGTVIRDSFTMPLADYALIGVLKRRCIGLGVAIKKSELLRAGLVALEQLPDASLSQVVAAIETIKTGRPPGKAKKNRKVRAKGIPQ